MLVRCIGLIMRDKGYLTREYPDMEYWTGCRAVPGVKPHKRPILIDHPTSPLYFSASVVETRNSGVEYPKSPPILPRIYVQFIIETKGKNSQGLISTSEHAMVIEVLPQWSRLGSSRFLELVYEQYFTNMPFFRSIKVIF